METPFLEGIARFQSPNLLAHLRTLWTWAALIVAGVATFNSIIRRSKRVILRFRNGSPAVTHPAPPAFYDSDGDDVSDDEDAAEEAGDEEVDSESETDFGDFDGGTDTQGQNGKSDRHLHWPEMAGDGGVVKLWDGLGLGSYRSNGSTLLLDLNRHEILRSFPCESEEIPAVYVASPATFVSARNGGLMVWDARAAGATWQAEGLGRLVGIVGGKKNELYAGDDVGKLTVEDLRSFRSPLAEAAWLGDGGDGLVSWCNNASRCFTLTRM